MSFISGCLGLHAGLYVRKSNLCEKFVLLKKTWGKLLTGLIVSNKCDCPLQNQSQVKRSASKLMSNVIIYVKMIVFFISAVNIIKIYI